MWTELKLYVTCFVAIVAIDLLWIGVIMKSFYVEQMRPIGRISSITVDKFEPVLWAAGVVYIALAMGVVQFALPRIGPTTSWIATFAIGALLGFVIYATYDFTNYSTLKDWTLALTLADTAWGAILVGLVTCIARYVREI